MREKTKEESSPTRGRQLIIVYNYNFVSDVGFRWKSLVLTRLKSTSGTVSTYDRNNYN